MSKSARIRSNEWHRLTDAAAAVETTGSVTVVVPCRDPGPGLERLIGSLATQERLGDCELVVVDDNSREPIRLADVPGLSVRVVRLAPHDTFGAGMARNAGAREASGSNLVFLDADMLVGRRTIHDLVRWIELVEFAMVTGILRFVTDEELDEAYDNGHIDVAELAAKGSDDQSWRNKHFERSFDFTLDRTDLYHSTIGACIAVSRNRFEAVGGFREVGVRGIEDTEFGHRLHNAGALMILERDAVLVHQGIRSFDSARSAEIKRIREPYMLDLLPGRKFGRKRPEIVRRQVPTVLIDCNGLDAGSPVVRSLLAEATQDIAFMGLDHHDPRACDHADIADLDARSVPYRLDIFDSNEALPEGLVETLIKRMDAQPLGALHLIGASGQVVARWQWVRAINRAGLVGVDGEIGRVFPEAWIRLEMLSG